ncbi:MULTISPECIES: TnsA endonuclease N-terminal domain-containing protein [Paraburkholderia]|nr:TnsA endonuclease N-terminal domain-containing protein [Paraburkholderia podalyriae]
MLKELPTSGTAAVVHGIRVSRNYELLDTKSTAIFYLLERRRTISDIRERWPILDLNRTLQLAYKFDVVHPCRAGVPEPLTFDFLITDQTAEKTYKAINLFRAENSLNAREQSLMRIRKAWCDEKGVDWVLVDSSPISRTVVHTLRFIRTWYVNCYKPNAAVSKRFSERFLKEYARNVVLDELVEKTGRYLGLRPDTRLDTFRYCAWIDQIPVSLKHRLACDLPLVLRLETHD